MLRCYLTTFGARKTEILDLCNLLENALNIKLISHDSSYRGGEYYYYSGEISDSIHVENIHEDNIDLIEHLSIEYSCIMSVDNCSSDSFINEYRNNFIKEKLAFFNNIDLLKESLFEIDK